MALLVPATNFPSVRYFIMLHGAVTWPRCRVICFRKGERSNATDTEMATICCLLQPNELIQEGRITDKFSEAVLKRLPDNKHLRIKAGRLTTILKHMQALQRAVIQSDVQASIFLAAAMYPQGIEARTLKDINVLVPEKFVSLAARKHELRKQRPVVRRGTR